jgi:hypothetical protein
MKSNGTPHEQGPLREEALQAMRTAVGHVIAEHKRHGVPLVIWRDGQVVEISPEEAEAEYLAAKAKDDSEAAQSRNGS